VKNTSQVLVQKEALFNEVKGSLFEYLVARGVAKACGNELDFLSKLDPNYLSVLGQQDRMVRQFYPEMGSFLSDAAAKTCSKLNSSFEEKATSSKVVGKFSNSSLKDELNEADIIIEFPSKVIPVSLKINKKNSYVNTKSGGIKSFFQQYFPFINIEVQKEFNSFVDTEFNRMAFELHSYNDMEYAGNFSHWIGRGFSELPGELDQESRQILKSYYARISLKIHSILQTAFLSHPDEIKKSIPPLMGFSSKEITQVIYFHEFPSTDFHEIEIHTFDALLRELDQIQLLPFSDISSVEFQVGDYSLQLRVKPMNKFTTTAIKINCSVKFKQPSIS